MCCLFTNNNVFWHLNSLACNSKLILAWAHELTCTLDRHIAAGYSSKAVLPVVLVPKGRQMRVFSNWHLCCIKVCILLNSLNFFFQSGIEWCLSQLFLEFVITREKEHLRLARWILVVITKLGQELLYMFRQLNNFILDHRTTWLHLAFLVRSFDHTQTTTDVY